MNAPARTKLGWRSAINGATVFVFALAVRFAYAFWLAPRQLCGFNDRANFDCVSILLACFKQMSPALSFSALTMGRYVGSLPLQDVLLKNGPVYPFYLAAQAKFFGLQAGFDPTQVNCFPFIVINIIVDSLACVMIYYTARFAFSRRAAAVAAALAIVYPAAVANTLHCYAEPLCYFMISAWLCLICSVLLRHTKPIWNLLSYLCIGALSALIVFCIPTLVMLPVITGAALFIYKFGEPIKAMLDRASNKLDRLTASPAVPPLTGGAQSQSVEEETQKPPSVSEPSDSAGTDAEPSSAPLSFEPNPASDLAASSESGSETAASTESNQGGSETAASTESNQAGSETAASTESDQAGSDTAASAQPSEAGAEIAAAVPSDSAERRLEAGSSNEDSVPAGSRRSDERAAATLPVVPKRAILAAILILVGAVAVTAPWYMLQNEMRHHFDFVSEPILAARMWLGNLSTSEGWRLLPANEFPVSSISIVLHSIFSTMLSIPVPYFALLMQKVARLFSASWNDYQLSVFGLSPWLQNIFHGLILFTASIGFAFASLQHSRWRHSRMLPCVVALMSAIIYHLFFCAFHCSSRNAFTAIPAILVLSGFCIDRVACHIREVKTQFVIMLVVAACFFGWLLSASSLVPIFASMIPSDVNARFADLVVVGAAWLLLLSLALPFARLEAGQKVSVATDSLKFACFCAILVMIGCGFDEHWREWKADLKNEHEIAVQFLALPPLNEMPDMSNRLKPNQAAFILVDVQSPFLAPPLAVTVNDVAEIGPAFPWLQLRPFDRESMQDIQIQARGMGVDWRSFRQWWAVPVPYSALRFGAANKITVSLLPTERVASHRIFGQYGSATSRRNDSYLMLPSPYTMSWEKGFATYAAGDMRLPESIVLQGKAVSSQLQTIGAESTTDLSFDHGTQSGNYRIRLALPLSNGFMSVPVFYAGGSKPEKPAVPELTDEIKPFEHEEATGIAGKDAASQLLTTQPVSIGQSLPAGSVFVFQSELKSLAADQTASFQVEFSGKDFMGREEKWVSPWQPDCISLSKDWQLFTFADFIPDSVQMLTDLHVSIRVIPFDGARRLLHETAALSQEMAYRHASLMVMPPLAIPAEHERDWVVF